MGCWLGLRANQPGQVFARPSFAYTYSPENMCLEKSKADLLLQAVVKRVLAGI
jgi:hypothetical protein